jgi:hypothetical protein
VARSASRIAATGLALALAGLTGCDTTQDKSARARLQAQRTLAGREAVRIATANPAVEIGSTELVRSGRRVAVAVRVRNRSGRPLNDLPIAVWLRAPHRRAVQLNRGAGLPYFRTHLPGIPAGGEITWVLPTSRAAAASSTAFVRVGTRLARRIETAASIPSLSAVTTGLRGATVTAKVTNTSDVPQYGLQLYAVAQRGGRLRAAGTALVEHIGPGHTKTVHVPLVGRAGAGPITVEAPPTIFS